VIIFPRFLQLYVNYSFKNYIPSIFNIQSKKQLIAIKYIQICRQNKCRIIQEKLDKLITRRKQLMFVSDLNPILDWMSKKVVAL